MFNKNTVKGTKTWFNQIREQEKKRRKLILPSTIKLQIKSAPQGEGAQGSFKYWNVGSLRELKHLGFMKRLHCGSIIFLPTVRNIIMTTSIK